MALTVSIMPLIMNTLENWSYKYLITDGFSSPVGHNISSAFWKQVKGPLNGRRGWSHTLGREDYPSSAAERAMKLQEVLKSFETVQN
jgi:hypothetical protein